VLGHGATSTDRSPVQGLGPSIEPTGN
jgi:hypothetical protein